MKVLTFSFLLFAAPVFAASPCGGQLSLWTPAEYENSLPSQWLQAAARAEGVCDTFAEIRVWGRMDLYALPGKAAPTSPTTTNVGAFETALGVSRAIVTIRKVTISAAVFDIEHGALANGVLKGGVSNTFCPVAARVDYGSDYSVMGVCVNDYKPLGTGKPFVGTIVLPVKGVVGVAANFAIITWQRKIVAVGPTATWK